MPNSDSGHIRFAGIIAGIFWVAGVLRESCLEVSASDAKVTVGFRDEDIETTINEKTY
jgi:hypothetical protein